MKKLHIIVSLTLVVLSIILFIQLKEANKKIEIHKATELAIFRGAIHDYTNDLSFIGESLLAYRDDFTIEENELYNQLLSSYSLRINRIGTRLIYIKHVNPTDSFIYEGYIHFIENLLSDEEFIIYTEVQKHEIGSILKKYGMEISNQFSGQIDYEDETKMKFLLEIISNMNEEISKVLNEA
ncbi:hypothetical protein [Sutcliffiella cohnii]|uniref:hypothetical protein n=1 Tax=Sutcliffiella cohnii TaxID=33932 RepID=UPI002E21AC2E|nr:hypothetical protein [Sutcliffiella cohnii]